VRGDVCVQTAPVGQRIAFGERRSRTLLPAMTMWEKLMWWAALAVLVAATVLSVTAHGSLVTVANAIVPFALLVGVVTTWRARKRAS